MGAVSAQSRASRRPSPAAGPFAGYAVVVEDGCDEEVRTPDGRFYRYDPDTVAFYCCNEQLGQRIRRRLKGQITTFTQGDAEITFHMPNAVYEEVAQLAGAPRKGRARRAATAH